MHNFYLNQSRKVLTVSLSINGQFPGPEVLGHQIVVHLPFATAGENHMTMVIHQDMSHDNGHTSSTGHMTMVIHVGIDLVFKRQVFLS